MIPLQPHPLSSLSILCTEDYAGPHMFEVCIIPNASKNPWEVSQFFGNMGTKIIFEPQIVCIDLCIYQVRYLKVIFGDHN